MKFQTSLGNTFEAGKPHNLYLFPSGDSFLAGFMGAASDDGIHRLGAILYKPIKSAQLTGIKWPTIDADTGDLTAGVQKLNFCNDSDKVKEETFEVKKE